MQHEAAQRGEVVDEPEQRVMPAPWVRRRESSISLTQILFGANVAVFVAMLLASGNPAAFLDPTHEFSPAVSIHYGANFGPLTLSGDWWRLFTYMFLHGSLLHIGFNMWCLWDLGKLCESLYGRWTYLSIYLITGVAGGLASVGWNPGIWSVGASGAVFGLAGALIASFYLGEFSFPQIAIRGTLRSLLFFAGFNLLFGSMFPGIDNSCHIGGLVSGLALGAAIARLAPDSQTGLKRAGVVGMVALAIALIGFGVWEWRGARLREARQYQSLAEKGNSVAQLEMIVRKQPNSVPAHFALAQTYFSQQKFPQAEAEFKRIIELQPKNESAHFDLGLTYLNQQRTEEAKTVFSGMLAGDPGSGAAHYGLGEVLKEQKNWQGAAEEFKKAADTGTEISGVYFELGNCYSQLKMFDDAIGAYLKEKQKDGDDPDLESALADAYDAKGMTQQAQEARNRALQLKGQAGH